MLPEKVKSSNIGVGVGFVLEIGGRVLMLTQHTQPLILLGAGVTLVGVAAFVWGCFNYSAAKGHSPLLGLLGLFSCIGLFVLLLLPDKYKNGAPPPGMGGPTGNQPGVWPPPPNPPS